MEVVLVIAAFIGGLLLLEFLGNNAEKIEDGIQGFRNGQAMAKYDQDLRRLGKELATLFKELDNPNQFDTLMYGFIYQYFNEDGNNPHFFAKRLLEPHFQNESDIEQIAQQYAYERIDFISEDFLDVESKLELRFLRWAIKFYKAHPEVLFFENIIKYKEKYDMHFLGAEELAEFDFYEFGSVAQPQE